MLHLIGSYQEYACSVIIRSGSIAYEPMWKKTFRQPKLPVYLNRKPPSHRRHAGGSGIEEGAAILER